MAEPVRLYPWLETACSSGATSALGDTAIRLIGAHASAGLRGRQALNDA